MTTTIGYAGSVLSPSPSGPALHRSASTGRASTRDGAPPITRQLADIRYQLNRPTTTEENPTPATDDAVTAAA